MGTRNKTTVTTIAFMLLLAMAAASSKPAPALAERESTNLDVRMSAARCVLSSSEGVHGDGVSDQ